MTVALKLREGWLSHPKFVPVSVYIETFGTDHQDKAFLEAFVRENYDLTPKGIIEKLHLLDVDYNKVSSYGHFGKAGLPWES